MHWCTARPERRKISLGPKRAFSPTRGRASRLALRSRQIVQNERGLLLVALGSRHAVQCAVPSERRRRKDDTTQAGREGEKKWRSSGLLPDPPLAAGARAEPARPARTARCFARPPTLHVAKRTGLRRPKQTKEFTSPDSGRGITRDACCRLLFSKKALPSSLLLRYRTQANERCDYLRRQTKMDVGINHTERSKQL